MNRFLQPRHRCWWCKELFEESEMIHEKSGWLCIRCHDYLCIRCHDYLKTQGG